MAEKFAIIVYKLKDATQRAQNECVKPLEELLELPLPSIIALKNPWMLEVAHLCPCCCCFN